ncbi:unnamed protein product, partial [Staurois parvus]
SVSVKDTDLSPVSGDVLVFSSLKSREIKTRMSPSNTLQSTQLNHSLTHI